jgi:hypothetical protein
MSLPITIPYTFANATTSIPLSQLDSNFTIVTNAINGIANGVNSLANVAIIGGAINNVAIGATVPSNGTFSSLVSNASVADVNGNVRQLSINNQTSAYVLIASDAGKTISITTGGVTLNSGIFSAGDNITIYNNSGSNQTITQGTSVTIRQAGTANTGSRTLAQYGVCTLLCVASNTFTISGAGLS